MNENATRVSQRASEVARVFGLLIRNRRRILRLTQDQLALATGVGRRFLIDLEAGKPTSQLGLSLVVAEAVGLRPADILTTGDRPDALTSPDLPALTEKGPADEEEPHG